MAKRAFISFQMEDQKSRNFLSSQTKDERNDLEFTDYSVKDPWDNSWKTECKKRITQTTGTIVLVGTTTHDSLAVEWEIKESRDQGHPVFGVWLRQGSRPTLPSGLSNADMVPWEIKRIIAKIDEW